MSTFLILLIIAWLGFVGWFINALSALNKADRIVKAYIDWRYEDFFRVDERVEPRDIGTVFEDVISACTWRRDPFAPIHVNNREEFRQWYNSHRA